MQPDVPDVSEPIGLSLVAVFMMVFLVNGVVFLVWPRRFGRANPDSIERKLQVGLRVIVYDEGTRWEGILKWTPNLGPVD